MNGCKHNGSKPIYIPKEEITLNLRGIVNLNNIKFPTVLCGNNSYQFRDLSVFNLTIQDDLKNKTSVSSNGEFSFNEMEPCDQVVIFCTNASNTNLIFEWMGASTSGLSGQINATINLFSTARSLIARTLRDRYGKRIKPEYISDEYIKTTVDAITEVIEFKPELLKDTKLSEIESIKETYTKMADSLAKASGAYPNEHVFLFYFAGDNDLGIYHENTVNKIAEAGVPSDTQIIIGLDTSHLLPLLNKPGAARYKVVGNKLEVLNDIGDVDSTNSLVLEKFIETTVREYPSKGYSLILSSHGGSWRDRERLYQSNRAVFMNDFTSLATGTILNTAVGIEQAFNSLNASNRKFDLIILDSCNMGCIETAYELCNYSDYLVFSQALMPSNGMPYDGFFKEISNKGISNISSLDKAKVLCDLFSEKYITNNLSFETGISIIDNSFTSSFVDSYNNYIKGVYDKRETYAPLIYNIRTTKIYNDGETISGDLIQSFSPLNEFVDLKQLIEESHEKLLDVKILSDDLRPRFKDLVKYSKYSESLKNANGISVTLPEKNIYNTYYTEMLPVDEYNHLKFNNLTNWNEFLEYMLREK